MRITKVKLDNYVCFYDAPEFELGPGINFVVGKNNSGKTALLDALTLKRRSPHRSLVTDPDPDLSGYARVFTRHWIEYNFDFNDVIRYLRRQHNQSSPQPIGINPGVFWLLRRGHLSDAEVNQHLEQLRSNGLTLQCNHDGKSESDGYLNEIDMESFFHNESGKIPSEFTLVTLRVDSEGGESLKRTTNVSFSNQPDYAQAIWKEFWNSHLDRSWRADAHRVPDTSTEVANKDLLCADFSNLAQVLSNLKSGPSDPYQEYVSCVRAVLPEVHDVFLEPVADEDGRVAIQVADDPSVRDNPHLARQLAECGTGVAQILAMLYVVVSSRKPRVLIIDEPNSFLHPGAVRELFAVFQKYNHHQYIVATNTPAAIMSVQKKRILLVEREDMRSTVKSVDVTNNSELEAMLKSIGTRRSDIFGMDAVIWVEGKTDEQCFKLIMDAKGGLPDGILVQALVNATDLDSKKHARLALQVYEKMSGSIGIQPTALGFLFDGDNDGVHDALQSSSDHQFCYLPRQNYESYLLDYPDIIAGVLRCEQSAVEEWIEKNRGAKKYYAQESDVAEEGWRLKIDGAKFIENLFDSVSDGSIRYNKVKHGEALTRRILEKHPGSFTEIVDLIKEILQKNE